MGELNVEVKILRKAPILFAWENKLNNVVESYLVTCPCQQLDLHSAGSDADGSGTFRRGDREWAAKLAQALEVSEVVSFSSIEPCVSISKGVKLVQGSKEESNFEKETKKVKKSRKQKKVKFDSLENRVDEEDGDSLHSEEDEQDDVEEEEEGLSVAMVEGETVQIKSQSSMEEDLSSSVECHDGQKDSEVSHKDVMPTSDTEGYSISSLQQLDGGNLVNKTFDSVPDDVVSSAVKTDIHSNKNLDRFEVPTLIDQAICVTNNEEHLNDDQNDQNKNQVFPSLQVTLPDGKVEASGMSKVPITITQVTCASSLVAPVPDEQALINAIGSIIEEYPRAVMDEPQSRQLTGASPGRKCQVNFIRSLTEEERKDMFKFRSDTYERNLKKLAGGGKCFLCEHCGKILSLSVRKRHMETHSDVPRAKNFVCDQCGKKFHGKSNLRHHLESHSSEHSYKCRYCEKAYKTVYGRTMHERAHFNVYVGQCDKCERKFKDLSKLRSHISSGCSTTRASTFRRNPRSKYRTHKAEFTLNKEDPGTSTCNICNKVVPTESLPSHMDTHAERMFTCPICKKIVKYSTRYAHLKVHSDKRDYVCQVCTKSFKTKTTLITHMRTHTGERPLKCRYCERSFSRYSSREVHETSHTGERPFPCTICNKGWKDRPTYTAHMKKHHPGAPLFYRRKSAMINQLVSGGMVAGEEGASGN